MGRPVHYPMVSVYSYLGRTVGGSMLEIPVGWLLVPLIPVIVGWLLGWLTPVISERITLWIRGPKLQLDFTTTDDCLTITPEEFQVTPSSFEKRDVFFARIRVTNLKPRIATKCQAWLISVEADDGQGNFKPTVFKDSIPLIWSYNAEAETIDIAQRVNRYLDLVRIQDNLPGFQPQMRSHSGNVMMPLRYHHLFSENRTLRFTVLVSAQDIKPQRIQVVVSRGDQWPPRAEMAS
jgi:hypothetical protein